MRSTGCGLRGRPLYWQSSTAQAWWVISAGRGSRSLSPGGVLGCPLPGRGAGSVALRSEDADVGLLPTSDGTLPACAAGLLRHVALEHYACTSRGRVLAEHDTANAGLIGWVHGG